ncbi:hypothetical protein [Curtobacterium flaccumfaciens]|uniref:hypothetical protein n=1 Tax=Curtobacterium flaccumfaciens TaxID=2035 RepID=UPI00387955E5
MAVRAGSRADVTEDGALLVKGDRILQDEGPAVGGDTFEIHSSIAFITEASKRRGLTVGVSHIRTIEGDSKLETERVTLLRGLIGVSREIRVERM